MSHLGVIEDVRILLGPGMTALTGETGAGKTLLVDAIQLLLGGTAESMLVRPGASEAVVEGRFTAPVEASGDQASGAAPDGREVILSRIVPATGRSRAYAGGRMVAAADLAERGRALVDLHGQHAQQSLLGPTTQRAALDSAAGIATDELTRARHVLREFVAAQNALGGDARTRARELDLLRYQLQEIDAAGLEDPDEDEALQAEEERLADASGLRGAASVAWQGLSGDDGVVDRLGAVVTTLAGRKPLAELEARLRALESELVDAAGEARTVAEAAEDDPARLAAVGARRQTLTDLRRKYGETLAAVMDFQDEVRSRVEELESHDTRAASLELQRENAARDVERAETRIWSARREAGPEFAEAVEARLHELAMPKARFEVEIGSEVGSEAVTWKLGANPGEPVLPLTKVASGGELARTMLATRLVIGSRRATAGDDGDPETLIFDEVDSGIGGEAAVAVGRALSALSDHHQVLVVTHLPQVAAFADRQLVVRKESIGERTVARVIEVEGAERVIELSRMLSGSPGSETAQRHAEELLAKASGRAG